MARVDPIDRVTPTQRPAGKVVQRPGWHDLAFLHWRVPVSALRPLVPASLEIDTFEGDAFIGLVPFTMTNVRPWWAPPMPGSNNFHETNVRTYVHRAGRDPGVWFFSLDAASFWAVLAARLLWHLPYHHARMTLDKQGRFACVDRGTGFELVPDMPSGIGLDVWPISRTDLWFSGFGGSVAHYDGARWTKHVWPKFYFDFLHVFARSGTSVWLKTAQKLVHFDGTNFQLEAPPELLEDTWSVVWGDDEDLYVLLNRKTESGFARRDRDGRWSRAMLGFGGATLVAGAKNDLWIMSSGEGGWHFDGTTWTRHPTGKGQFWSLYAEPGRAFIAGDNGSIGRWDGTRWTIESMGSDQLMAICRQRDGRLLVGGTQLYREREPYSPK